MQNYKYRFTDGYEVVSEEEHRIITSNIQQGKTKTFLRNGELMINSNLVSRITKTIEPTPDQDLERLNSGRILAEVERGDPTKGLKKLKGWAEKQDWFVV